MDKETIYKYKDTINKYFVWQVRRSIVDQKCAPTTFESNTGLNLSRVLNGDTGFSVETQVKIYIFFKLDPDDFWKDYKLFLEIYKNKMKADKTNMLTNDVAKK